MAKQTGQSALLAKLGERGRKAHEQHKSDETTYSNMGELPGGIEGGIARLVDCKFDTYKKGNNVGEFYFYAAAVVVSPQDFNGQRVAGLRTTIMEPLHDTPTRKRATLADHIEWVYNELRKLGVDTSSISFEDLETVAAALKKSGPYIGFRTWKGDKQEIVARGGKYWVGDKSYPTEAAAKAANPFAGKEPRVNHDWLGLRDYSDDGDAADAVDDSSGDDESNGHAPAATSAPPKRSPPKKAEPEPEPNDDGPDLDALVADADGGDEEAQVKLAEVAKAAGIAEHDVESAESWAALAEMIRTISDGGVDRGEQSADEPQAADWEPMKEEVYLFRPLDPKTKRPAKKAIECEVIAVDKRGRTVGLKSLDDPKQQYKAVPWDSLESA